MKLPHAQIGPDLVVAAIGDIHGCYDALLALEDELITAAFELPAARRVLVYLGDYIDRGPDSKAVLEHLAADPPTGFERVALMGNHEALLLDCLDGGPARHWLVNGGAETCLSYGVRDSIGPALAAMDGGALVAALRDAIGPRHLALLRGLSLSQSIGDYLFVHAGVRPGVALEKQEPEDLLWIRKAFLNSDEDFGAVIVHGHTPADEPEIRANRINLDTGACFGGKLTGLLLHASTRQLYAV